MLFFCKGCSQNIRASFTVLVIAENFSCVHSYNSASEQDPDCLENLDFSLAVSQLKLRSFPGFCLTQETEQIRSTVTGKGRTHYLSWSATKLKSF